MIKKIILTFLTLILMLLLAALVIPFLIPAEEYQKQFLTLAESKLGRKITVEGPVKFTLLPKIALQAENITIANAPGFTGPYLAKIKQLNLNLQPWPLLDKQVVVDELTLVNPDVYLEKTAGDRTNWKLAPKTKDDSKTVAAYDPKSETQLRYNVSAVKISDGELHFYTPDQQVQAKNFDLRFSLEELNLDAQMFLQDMPVNFSLSADTPSQLWDGRDLPILLKAQSDHLQLQLNGAVKGINLSQGKFNWQYAGSLQAKSDSLAQLQKQLNGTAGAWNGGMTLEAGQAAITPQKITLGILQAQLDTLNIEGTAAIFYAEKKPRIQGSLTLSPVNLEDFTGKSANTPTASPAGAGSDTGWSADPMDFSALTDFNADLTLKTPRITAYGLALDNIDAQINLKNSKLKLSLPGMVIGGGKVSVQAALDASAGPLQWRKEVSVANVPFEAIAGQFMENNRLLGTTGGSFFFSGRGNSMREWMNTLSGGGDLSITNGTIKGFSLSRLFRTLRSATVDPQASNENTAFSDLSVNFTADNGVMTIKQGVLQSPQLQASATGNISLRDKTLNLRLKPVIVPRLAESEEDQAAGLLVPLKIKGPFNDVHIRPDLTAAVNEALTNPQSAKDAATVIREEGRAIKQEYKDVKESVKENWKQLKDTRSPDALNSLLGTVSGATGLKLPTLPGAIVQPGQPEPVPQTAPVTPESVPATPAEPEPVIPQPEPAAPPAANGQ